MPLPDTLPAALKSLAERDGRKQADLAEACGVNRTTMIAWFRPDGPVPGADKLERFLVATGATDFDRGIVRHLLGGAS